MASPLRLMAWARAVRGSTVIVRTLFIGRSGLQCRHRVSDSRCGVLQQGEQFIRGVCGVSIEPSLLCLDGLSSEALILAAMKQLMPYGEISGVEVIAEGLILHEPPSGVRHGAGRRHQIGDNILIVALRDGRIGIRSDIGVTEIGHLIRDLAPDRTAHFEAGRGRRRRWAARTRRSAWGTRIMGVCEGADIWNKLVIGFAEFGDRGSSRIGDAAGVAEIACDSVCLLS